MMNIAMNWIAMLVLPGLLSVSALLAGPPATRAQEAQELTTYLSPTWGYTLAWSSDWEVIASFDDQSDHGVTEGLARGDYLLLSAGLPNGNSVSLEIMAGVGYEGEPAPCLERYEADIEALQAQSNDEISIQGFRVAEADGQPLAGADQDSAFGVYEYAMTGEEFHWNLVDYVECRTLVDGSAVIRIEASTLRENYEAAVPLIEPVLATLTLTGADGGATPVPVRTLPPQLDPLPGPLATPSTNT